MPASGDGVKITGQVQPGLIVPSLVIDQFLGLPDRDALLDWALANEARFAPASLAGGIVDDSVRRASSLRDLGPLDAVLRARVTAAVPGWVAQLRVTPFDIHDIELELAAHNDGAHFHLHSDTYASGMKTRGDRLLSAVYYFYRGPAAFAGGALRLHRLGAEPGDTGQDIAPIDNRMVVFPSWGPHEVMPVSCPSRAFADSRFAVNCWVYRARR
ncbi:2OG-Fe(II) oxygenase [Sphingomonas sp. AR_OL41]|uniref:2OG-Fe(II) oxygenase n=1 Tax=Sphingomonas sp. AR_OL41 TaxID=3042729 RepID=UPI0024816F24|nr:2OG-Fe(II) oxygenase [Sphingomonas sp. AR_OL41]MDH7972652.1 2OG-Fe(II) oxygenase [Sphingomonas sp. AR_OL41]